MRYSTVIFDFGNVLALFDYARATERLGASRGRSGRDVLAALELGGWTELHHEYEHGRLTSESFAAQVLTLAAIEADFDEFKAAWSSIFTRNESIVPILRSLRAQGYRLLLGSNTNALHAQHIRSEFAELLANFDALVLSFEIGQMKPSAAFYEACVRAAGRPAAECVFLDDLPANVAGANQAGLTGLLYTNPHQLAIDLNALGIATGSVPA